MSCGSTWIFSWLVISLVSSKAEQIFMPPPQMLSKSRVHPTIKVERFSGKRFALKHLQRLLVAHCSLSSPFLNLTVVNPFLSLSFGNNSTWEGERSIFHSGLECKSQWEKQNGRTAVKGFNKWLFCSTHWVLHLKNSHYCSELHWWTAICSI